jgi:hypothetical protein
MYTAGFLVTAMLLAAPQHSNMTHAAEAMGFDLTTTRHDFKIGPDGGSIAVDVRDAKDSKTRDQIRMHLRHISTAFKDGDVSLPLLTHGEMPPGVDVMKEKKDAIVYSYADTPHGAIVRIRTSDADALAAIHAFLKYQTTAHRNDSGL